VAGTVDAPAAASRYAGSRIVYLAIGAGLLATAAAFVYVRQVIGVAPFPPGDSTASAVAYALAAIAAAQVGVALLVLKPRVPQRMLGQSLDEYWSADVAGKCLIVWALIDTAGMLSAVGYLLSGATVSAIAAAIAIVLYGITGPGSFARG
jgi:hypothetical protein